MPCLESVTIGDDIWDENWLPLQAKMGKESNAASHLFTSSLGGKKPYSSCKEIPQKVSSLGKHKENHKANICVYIYIKYAFT